MLVVVKGGGGECSIDQLIETLSSLSNMYPYSPLYSHILTP